MGTKTKDEGIAQVIQNNLSDYNRIFGFAKDWIRTKTSEFTAEDLKVDFLKNHEPIRQQNVYGAVINSLAKNGRLTYIRHDKAKLPKARSRYIGVWQSNGQIKAFA